MATYKIPKKEDVNIYIKDLNDKIKNLELPVLIKADVMKDLAKIELEVGEILDERDDLEDKVEDLEDEVEDLERELEEFEDITLYKTKTIEGNPSSYSEDVLRNTLMGIWRDRHLISTDKNKMSIIESVARM